MPARMRLVSKSHGLFEAKTEYKSPFLVQVLLFFCASLLLTLSCSTWAQIPVNPALEIQRQQLREQELRREFEPSPDVRLLRQTIPDTLTSFPQESPCFAIDQILLTGDLNQQFQFALDIVLQGDKSALGHCLGVQGINLVLTRVQNAIIEQGYITTRVLTSPQNLQSGTLNLTVVPGRIQHIHFDANSSSRGRYWNALPATSGDILNLRDIEQGLENLKRVPTAEADIRIEPSTGQDSRPGDSDIVIAYQQTTPFRITLSADDSGSPSTGKYQGSLTLSGDNLLTLNDLFYYSINHDIGGHNDSNNGTKGYTLHYSMPFAYWLASVTHSNSDYQQAVAGATQTFTYSGESSRSELKLARLIYRDATRKTTAALRTYLSTSNNYIDDTEIEVQRRRMTGWQGTLSHKEFIGAAILDLDLAYRRGTGLFNAISAPEEQFNEGTARPKIITAYLNIHYPFKIGQQVLRFHSNWRGQWNKSALIAQDRFAIGGRYTVRGFDGQLTLSGERGWLWRNDLGLKLGKSGQELYLAFDYGHVSGRSAQFLLGTHLAGGVIGIRGGYESVYWDVFTGGSIHKPKGFNPSTGTSGFNLTWTY